MRKVGDELGLQVSKEGRRWNLNGRIDDIGVAVKNTTENVGGETRWFTDFNLYAPDQPHGRIVGAGLREKVIRSFQDANRLHTGDADFDEAVFVEGSPAEMLAHLDAAARKAVRAATAAGWELDGVTWKARESGRLMKEQKIRSLLELGLTAARAIRREDEVAAALSDRAANDPSPGVRAAAAAALAEDTGPATPPTAPLP